MPQEQKNPSKTSIPKAKTEIPAHMRPYYNRAEVVKKFGSELEEHLANFESFSNRSRLALIQALGNMCRDQARKTTATLRSCPDREPVNIGDTVIICGGEAQFLGMQGEITKIGRTRCLVKVPSTGIRKFRTLYLYLSEIDAMPQSLSSAAN
jgi:hypothetical protein